MSVNSNHHRRQNLANGQNQANSTMAMTAKQIGKRIKAKGLGRLKFYCQMCQKQCRDENGFKCHTTSETHLRQMELFSQNPTHYLDQLSNEFEESFLKLLSRRFNTTTVDSNKVYNEFIQDKEHSHMNATKWETLSGFIQYLGRTGKVRVEETDRGLYITWIDTNPEARARAEKNAKNQREALDDQALNEKLMKQRLALAKAAGINMATTATARDDTVSGIQLDSEGNIVLGMGSRRSSSSSSTTSTSTTTTTTTASRKRSALDSRPTLMFGGGSSSSSKSKAVVATAAPIDPTASPTASTSTTFHKPTISFELPPTKKTKYNENTSSQPSSSEPRSKMWMCESLIVKIKNKTVGNGLYYKKKARISKCNVEMLTADVRVLNDTGIKIRIHQKDLETVIPKPKLTENRSRVMLLRGTHRGLTGTLIALNVDTFNCDVELDDGTHRVVSQIEYEDVSKVLVIDPYKKKRKKKSKKSR